jgi:serine/threonine protein kinase
MFEEFQFGNYRLVKRLAASAASEVFLGIPATGPKTGRLVVIKRLLPEMAKIGIFAELLSNEARLGEIMDHPNVVKIFEYGSTGSELYLAMEFVDGLDLWRLIRRTRKSGRQLSQLQMLYVTAEVLKALAYLHGLSDKSGNPLDIVHHDVSPSNILISRIGEVKLGDFGISFSQHKNLPDAERKVRFRGKVHYISPEQIKGQAADWRSDIFSLGVVLAEMVLGKKPFEGPTDLSIMINIKDGRSRASPAPSTPSSRGRWPTIPRKGSRTPRRCSEPSRSSREPTSSSTPVYASASWSTPPSEKWTRRRRPGRRPSSRSRSRMKRPPRRWAGSSRPSSPSSSARRSSRVPLRPPCTPSRNI